MTAARCAASTTLTVWKTRTSKLVMGTTGVFLACSLALAASAPLMRRRGPSSAGSRSCPVRAAAWREAGSHTGSGSALLPSRDRAPPLQRRPPLRHHLRRQGTRARNATRRKLRSGVPSWCCMPPRLAAPRAFQVQRERRLHGPNDGAKQMPHHWGYNTATITWRVHCRQEGWGGLLGPLHRQV